MDVDSSKRRPRISLDTMPAGQTRVYNRQRGATTDYQQYIASPAWRARRLRFLRRLPIEACSACGSTDGVDLHHMTYERLGAEDDGDLVALCRTCHTAVHQLHDAAAKVLTLRQVTERFIKQMTQERTPEGTDTRICPCPREHNRRFQGHHSHKPSCACHRVRLPTA